MNKGENPLSMDKYIVIFLDDIQTTGEKQDLKPSKAI